MSLLYVISAVAGGVIGWVIAEILIHRRRRRLIAVDREATRRITEQYMAALRRCFELGVKPK